VAQDRDPSARADEHNERGIELADRGWLDEAAREFRKAIDLDPASPLAHENLAAVHAQRKEWRAALSEHLRAAELDPGGAASRFGLASFLLAHGLDLAAAEYREAATLDPDLPDVHLELGLALADLGQVEEALRELTAAVGAAPEDPVARHELALLLMDEGDHRAAIGHLREAVRLDPEAFEAHLDLGACYARKGFFAEAERAYARARDLRPAEAQPHYDLAVVQAQWGRPAEAVASLERAVALEGDKVRSWLAEDPAFEGLRGRDDFDALRGG
jgi:Flp pilus assembly protein TadD